MRRITMATVAGASLLLIACRAGQDHSTSPPGTPTSSVEQRSSFSPSDEPSALRSAEATAGEVLEGFHEDDILRVEVNSLAVRVAPYIDQSLATGATFDGTTWNPIGPVRLNTGDYVSVELGPVTIGDTTWYRVWPAEGGRLHYSFTSWHTDGTVDGSTQPAWVAAAVGSDAYLTLYEAFEFDRSLTGLPPTLQKSGIGDYVSGPLENHDLLGLEWIYLIDGQPAPCGFRVTLEPAGGGADLEAVDRSTSSGFEIGYASLGAGDFTPVVGVESEPFLVRVTSECEWSLRLEWLAHD